jgi:peptidoglycan/LPS O-acetylase OafA/YrhL
VPVRPRRAAGAYPLAESGARLHALDALRGGSLFLVVSLHAALAYTRDDVPRLLWGVREPSPHVGFDLFCWWAMGVSLPVFFLIAGFFAAELARARGLRGFAANRAERIGLPFAVAMPTVLPATFLSWSAGWLVTGRCTFREVRRMKFHAPGLKADLYGRAHLWFLEYLILMLLAFAAARWVWGAAARRGWRVDRTSEVFGGWLDRRLASPWRPLWLALPTAVVLWVSRERVGLDAALDRHNSFLPDPLRLLHHGLFFAVGVWLNRSRGLLGRFARPGVVYLGLSAPVFLARGWLLRLDWARPLAAPGALALVALGGMLAWLTVFGLLGVALRVFDRPSRTLRYLADASYWVYLVHMPVVGLTQADLYRVPVPTFVKFAATLGLTLTIGLGSYQVLVRHRAVGRALHGSRARE